MKRRILGAVSCGLLIGVVGCSARDSDPIAVAQVAVRANPALELVATDTQQGVLTVRIKRTARVVTVRAADVVAGTAFRDVDMTDPAPAPPAAAGPEPPPAAQAPVVAAAPSSPAKASKAVAHASVTPAGTAPMSPKAAPPTATAEMQPARTVPADPPANAPAAETRSSASSPGASVDEGRLQKRPGPVQCSGLQVVHLDGVLVEADRVAVQTLGQCRMRITNSKLVGRVGLMTTGDSTVTLENSIIEGTVAIEATGTSTSSVRSSTISGRVRKLQGADVKDLGQNIWR